jgi:uncharacterized short protein YbdD (DUF466 family)
MKEMKETAMSVKGAIAGVGVMARIKRILWIAGPTSIASGARRLRQSLRLMVGVPEYDTYVTHMRNKHPGQPIMPYREFFRERQEARYDGKVGRCC